jgi:hypothetical protein
MTSTTKAWLQSLIAAGVGGASSTLLSALAMPDVVNFTHAGLIHALKAALIGTLVPVLTLLKQSPVPSAEITTTTTAQVTTKVEGNAGDAK